MVVPPIPDQVVLHDGAETRRRRRRSVGLVDGDRQVGHVGDDLDQGVQVGGIERHVGHHDREDQLAARRRVDVADLRAGVDEPDARRLGGRSRPGLAEDVTDGRCAEPLVGQVAVDAEDRQGGLERRGVGLASTARRKVAKAVPADRSVVAPGAIEQEDHGRVDPEVLGDVLLHGDEALLAVLAAQRHRVRQAMRSAPGLWLVFRMTFTISARLPDTCSATRWSAGNEPWAGRRSTGLAPVGGAVTVTPARWSASMNAVRANEAGFGISPIRNAGPASAAIVPDTWKMLGFGWVTVRAVAPPAFTVFTVDVTRNAWVFGR